MSIGLWQVVLILLIVLIVFGSGKLPKVMEDIAKGLKSFRDGMGSNAPDVMPSPKDSKKVIEFPKEKKPVSSSKKTKKKHSK